MDKQKLEYSLEDFYYDLPEKLIAQNPVERRDESRLLILDRSIGTFKHSLFNRLTDYLKKGDLLVFNNAKVIHILFYGTLLT